MRNAGFLFYKEYFKQLRFDNGKPSLNFQNDSLYNLKLDYKFEELFSTEDCFELTTIYPGLLIGSGYNHEIGGKELEGELKLGFFFDYTTGLPCIPGSSVKGVLRDACEKVDGDYALSLIRKIYENKKDFILNEDYFQKGNKKYSDFVLHTFEGKVSKNNFMPLAKRDIFFDAFPFESQNDEGKFLANDHITHHENPLKNPNPVQFLKVLSQVVFRFNFRLTNENIPKTVKLELFRQILLDLGVGAKTNVGYGQFSDDFNLDHSVRDAKNAQKNKTRAIHTIPEGMKFNKNEEIIAKFAGLDGDYSCFKFTKGSQECTVKKKTSNVYKKLRKKGYEGELKEGDKVVIKIQENFLIDEDQLNFQVLMPRNTD